MTKNCEPAMNGVASTTSSEVEKFAQTSSGMRQNVMPGARMVMIVTRKLSAVMIELAPAHWTTTLNVGGLKYWSPGWASSARKSSAKNPPTTKKKNTVTRYWTPITLWSGLMRK